MSSGVIAARALALRQALDLSQERFAARAGLVREEISKVERGQNKVSSARLREAFARAADVPTDRLGQYLSGAIELGDLLSEHGRRRRPRRKAA